MNVLKGTTTRSKALLAVLTVLALAAGFGLPRIASAAPGLSIGDVSANEGTGASPTAFNFTITLSEQVNSTVTVNWATEAGTATAGATNTGSNDYVTTGGTVSFDPNQTTKVVTVNVTADSFAEPNESFKVRLSSPNGAAITDAEANGNITNDDGTAPVILVDTVTAIDEGNQPGTKSQNVVIKLSSGQAPQPITVNYTTVDDTATAGDDYVAASGTATINTNGTQAIVPITIIGDNLDEGASEQYKFNISNANNATLGTATQNATITDDDLKPTLTVNPNSVTEGDSGTTNIVATFKLSGPSASTIVANYATADDTATAGSDYVAKSGTVTFPPSSTTQTVSFTVNGDAVDEQNETFRVVVSGVTPPTSADVAEPGYGVMTINDDENEPVASIGNVTVTEGNSGLTNAVFTVSLSAASGRDVTLRVSTGDIPNCTPPTGGTCFTPRATAGTDYTAFNQVVTIPKGQSSKDVTITVLPDSLDEVNEQYRVNLTEGNGVSTPSSTFATGTITDDDAGPVISLVGDPSSPENAGSPPGFLRFTFHKEGETSNTVAVSYATADGSAEAGDDYTAAQGTAAQNDTRLMFGPNEYDKTIDVAIENDTLREPDETFTMNITGVANGTADPNESQSTGLIVNDDGTPVSISMTKTADATEGGTGATFRFAVVGTMTQNESVSVDIATENGTAVAPGDFTAVTQTLTFTAGPLPGQLTTQPAAQTVTVNAVNDTIDEPAESFTMRMVNGHNATLASPTSVSATITDNDNPPSIAIADKTITEGNANTANFLVATLTGGSTEAVTVNYSFGDAADTAKSPGDYTGTDGSLTFAPGEVTKNIPFNLVGDTLDEANEAFTVKLSNVSSNATISDGTGIANLTDDDNPPTVSINSVSGAEGGGLTFTATLSAASGRDVTVSVASANGTATAPGDYTAVPATVLTIPAGQTTVTKDVTTADDNIDEPNETFTLTLSAPTNATIATGGGTGTGTITDNDNAPVISISNASAAEGTSATFTLSLSNPSSSAVTVSSSSANGTATAPGDYTARGATTTTIAAGLTSVTFTVATAQDTLDEANETFTVTLANPTNATLSEQEKVGTGTIEDNDASPTVSITSASSVAEGAANVFTVTLSAVSGQDVKVKVATENVTASSADYTTVTEPVEITIPAGTTTKPVNVPTTQDTTDEDDETFKLNLSAPTNATLGSPASATATITDDDAAPSVGVSATASGSEGDDVVFTATLGAESGKDVTVSYSTAAGTASASDFTGTASGTVSIPKGTTTKTFAVPTVEDAVQESAESFTVTFNSATNATVDQAKKTGTGTINDDDGTNATTTTTSTTTTIPGSSTTSSSTTSSTSTTSTTIVPNTRPANITTGPGAGGGPHIKVFNKSGQGPTVGFMDGAESSGKRVARGDLTGDGVDEIITGSGAGSAAVISVYSASGNFIASSFAYADGRFAGGVFVAAGDIDGDGKEEVITSPGPGGGPHIKVWKLTGSSIASSQGFFAYGPEFTGGVTIASADVNGDGKADIVTGPGAGGGPHVRAFSGANFGELFGLMAYTNPQGQPNWTGGVNVAAGDVDGDGKAEIAVGPWQGGGPHVRLFNSNGSLRNGGIFAGNPSFTGGVSLAMGDLDGDGKAEILAGGFTQTTFINVYSGDLVATGTRFQAYEGFGGGVFIAVGKA